MDEYEDEDPEILKTCYSVGSYGPYPIHIYKRQDGFYYCGQEHREQGPFNTLKQAMRAAESDFGCSDGGFHEEIDDAEAHAEWMRDQGYGVE